MWLFWVFVAVPIIEIALFIQVGGVIGLWPTLVIVVLTALIGTTLMRRQGISTLNRLQNTLATGQNPADPIAHGAMILVAGVLLLTPGFFTDGLGMALLLPPVRVGLFKYVSSKLASSSFSFTAGATRPSGAPTPGGDTIEGDFSDLEDLPDQPGDKPSGWTKH